MSQNCFCCLKTPKNEKELLQFKENERILYSELTGNQISEEIEPKICKKCVGKLKTSVDFVNLCKRSFEKQHEIVSIEEDLATNNDDIIITVCEQNDNFLTDEDDDIPISAFRDRQLVIETETPLIEDLKIEILDEKLLARTKKYKCSECHKSFSSNQKLKLHEFTHTGVKDFSCDYEGCGKKFATEMRLRIHSRVHSEEKIKPYLCDVCSVSFSQSNALKCHKRVHSKEKPYVCPYQSCGNRSFSQKTILKTHIAAKHDKNLAVKCNYPGCIKTFPRNSFLMLHIKRDHEGKRLYVCEHCNKSYKQQSHLTRHVESIHLNVRHECNVCNKSFSKSWSLKMHKLTHSNNFPYKCSECDEMFQRRDKWLKHFEKFHPNVEIKKDPIEIVLSAE